MAKMKSSVFVEKAIDIAKNYKTLYVMGCFGAPMTSYNKTRYCNNHRYNRQSERTKMIKSASSDTFGFDCVCLIKAILWGWCGDASKSYGGAGYNTNGVPDISADQMIKVCTGVSSSGWANMVPGEVVWTTGHIGIYIGNGLAVEATPAWKNKVQITAVANIGTKAGYNSRTWKKHGKLPYVEYTDNKVTVPVKGNASAGSASDEQTIWNFLKGKGLNDYAIAGLIGNLYAESALKSNNLQQTYERKLGYTDTTYTAAVDNGTYDNFVNDSAGYGLAQWTFWSRKKGLLEYARSSKKSIGDLGMQLGYLWKELQGYKSVMTVLKSATSVKQASDAVLTGYERPANMNASVKSKRASYGQKYYEKYAKSIVKGDKVTVKRGAKTYTGGTLASFVYNTTYTVMQVNGDRAVIGINGVTTAAVNAKDLTLV